MHTECRADSLVHPGAYKACRTFFVGWKLLFRLPSLEAAALWVAIFRLTVRRVGSQGLRSAEVAGPVCGVSPRQRLFLTQGACSQEHSVDPGPNACLSKHRHQELADALHGTSQLWLSETTPLRHDDMGASIARKWTPRCRCHHVRIPTLDFQLAKTTTHSLPCLETLSGRRVKHWRRSPRRGTPAASFSRSAEIVATLQF